LQGLFNEVIGPTLPDLTDRLGVDYEKVSSALAAKSVGFATGAVIGGFLHEKFYTHSELILACGLWIGSVATVVVPFADQLALLATMFALSGVADGIINSGMARVYEYKNVCKTLYRYDCHCI
jgi:FHS family Na+ dependent glucose MFS transporter 1